MQIRTPATAPAVSASSATQGRPFVSVVLPVYNDIERLRLCLDALERQTYAGDRYEVIVVNNASTQPIDSVARVFPHVNLQFEATPGSYAARNKGIAVARGSVVAFTDSDCIPEAGWIEAGVEALQRDDVTVVCGQIDVFPANDEEPTPVELFESRYAFPKSRTSGPEAAATANLFTTQAVFDEVGVFDASLKSFGDVLWTSRAVARGHRLLHSDSVRVRHPARRSLTELGQRYARFAGGHYNHGLIARRLQGERLLALRMLTPPLRLMMRAATDPLLRGVRARIGVMAVAYYARLAYALEWCRLELGGAAKRE